MNTKNQTRAHPRSQRVRSRTADDLGIQPAAASTVISSHHFDWGSVADSLDLRRTSMASESALPKHSIISEKRRPDANRMEQKYKCNYCPASYKWKKTLN